MNKRIPNTSKAILRSIVIPALNVLFILEASTLWGTNLRMFKSAINSSFLIGDTITFTLSIDNTSKASGGPFDSPNTVVVDTLPQGLIFVSAEASNFAPVTFEPNARVLMSNLGTVLADSVVTITVVTRAETAGDFINTAAVSGSLPDPLPANNADSFRFRVVDPDAVPTSSANQGSSAFGNDPINTWTGELVIREPSDLPIPGPLSLQFKRYYASGLKRAFTRSRMGDNWRHNFDWALRLGEDVLTIIDHQGRVIRYSKSAGGWEQQTNLDTPRNVIEVTKESGSDFFMLDPQAILIYRFGIPAGVSSFRLLQILDTRGNQLSLTYNGDGDLERVSDGLGRSLTFIYDENANSLDRKLRSVTDGTRTVEFAFTGDLLTLFKDAGGNITQYIYDTAHSIPALLRSRVLPEGNQPFTQSWDEQGRVASQTDSSGNTTSFAYNGATTTMTNPRGQVVIHRYDASGNLIQVTNTKGQTRTIGNDETGRRSSVTQPLSGMEVTEFDPSTGHITSVTNAAGKRIEFQYTPRTVSPAFTIQSLSKIIFPGGRSMAYTYNANGDQLTYSDRAGNTWARTYNSRGQLLTVTNPLGGTYTNTYNEDGTRASQTDPAGNVTQFAYDSLKRPVRVTWADGTSREFTYDHGNRVTSFTDERGKTTTYAINKNGDIVSITDPDGHSKTRTYDNNGRASSLTDRTGATTVLAYDVLGLLSQATFSNSGAYQFQYDDEEKLTSIMLPDGSAFGRTIDANGRYTGGPNRGGENDTVTYSGIDQILTRTNADGNVNSYTYDDLGRPISWTKPTGEKELYSYAPIGRIAGITLTPQSLSTSFQYNALGQLTSLTDPEGNVWGYTYDNQGRALTYSGPLGNSMSFSYDNRNRVSQFTFPGQLGTLTVAYDGVGQATRRLYSDGTDLRYTHDNLGRLTSLNDVTLAYDAESRITASNGITATRMPHQGQVASLTLASGKTVTYTYNTAGQVAEVRDWLGGFVKFVYDPSGRVKLINRSNGTNTQREYNGQGRLVSINHMPGGSISLRRDPSGYLVGATRDLPLKGPEELPDTDYTYDKAYRINGHTYDAMGRPLQDDRRSYSWNLASLLQDYSENGATTRFAYNGFGHILSRTQEDGTQSYIWNYALPFPAISIIRENGSDLRYYIHHPSGTLLYSISADETSRQFFHFDERGNTVLLTGNSGEILVAYAYSPYGVVKSSNTGVQNPFTYMGRYGVMQQGDTGLYLMRQRFYDSRTKRFLSQEDLGPHLHPLTVNPYQYAAGNPIHFIDPVGLEPEDADGAAQETESGFTLDGVIEVVRSVALTAGTIGSELGDKADDLAKAADRALGASLILAHEAAKIVQKNLGGNDLTQRFARIAQRHLDDFFRLDAKANRLMGAGRTLKTIGRIGNGLAVLSVGVELWKLNDNLGRSLENHDSVEVSLYRVFIERSATAWDLFERGKKTQRWLESQLRIYKLELEQALLWNGFDYSVETHINFWTSVGDIYGSVIPGFGFLGTAEISNASHQNIWNKIY